MALFGSKQKRLEEATKAEAKKATAEAARKAERRMSIPKHQNNHQAGEGPSHLAEQNIPDPSQTTYRAPSGLSNQRMLVSVTAVKPSSNVNPDRILKDDGNETDATAISEDVNYSCTEDSLDYGYDNTTTGRQESNYAPESKIERSPAYTREEKAVRRGSLAKALLVSNDGSTEILERSISSSAVVVDSQTIKSSLPRHRPGRRASLNTMTASHSATGLPTTTKLTDGSGSSFESSDRQPQRRRQNRRASLGDYLSSSSSSLATTELRTTASQDDNCNGTGPAQRDSQMIGKRTSRGKSASSTSFGGGEDARSNDVDYGYGTAEPDFLDCGDEPEDHDPIHKSGYSYGQAGPGAVDNGWQEPDYGNGPPESDEVDYGYAPDGPEESDYGSVAVQSDPEDAACAERRTMRRQQSSRRGASDQRRRLSMSTSTTDVVAVQNQRQRTTPRRSSLGGVTGPTQRRRSVVQSSLDSEARPQRRASMSKSASTRVLEQALARESQRKSGSANTVVEGRPRANTSRSASTRNIAVAQADEKLDILSSSHTMNDASNERRPPIRDGRPRRRASLGANIH